MTRKYHESCGFPKDSMMHLRVCVPRKQWPENVKEAQRQRVDGTTETVMVAENPHVAAQVASELARAALTCECGYVAPNRGGLNFHRLRSKVHKEPASV